MVTSFPAALNPTGKLFKCVSNYLQQENWPIHHPMSKRHGILRVRMEILLTNI